MWSRIAERARARLARLPDAFLAQRARLSPAVQANEAPVRQVLHELIEEAVAELQVAVLGPPATSPPDPDPLAVVRRSPTLEAAKLQLLTLQTRRLDLRSRVAPALGRGSAGGRGAAGTRPEPRKGLTPWLPKSPRG